MLHQLLRIPTGGQLFVLLYCVKVVPTVDAMRFAVHSSPWCQGRKKKSIFKMLIFDVLEKD